MYITRFVIFMHTNASSLRFIDGISVPICRKPLAVVLSKYMRSVETFVWHSITAVYHRNRISRDFDKYGKQPSNYIDHCAGIVRFQCFEAELKVTWKVLLSGISAFDIWNHQSVYWTEYKPVTLTREFLVDTACYMLNMIDAPVYGKRI